MRPSTCCYDNEKEATNNVMYNDKALRVENQMDPAVVNDFITSQRALLQSEKEQAGMTCETTKYVQSSNLSSICRS